MSIHSNIYEVLKTIKIPKSYSRPNVSGIRNSDKYKTYGNPCESCSFGIVNNFFKSTTDLSKITLKYPEQYEKIKEYGNQICNHEFTSICINHNVKCLKHKDRNNVGNSTIIALGDFTDGGLWVDGELHDIFEKPLCFDGSKQEHWTQDFDGDRYSLVFFDNRKFRR